LGIQWWELQPGLIMPPSASSEPCCD